MKFLLLLSALSLAYAQGPPRGPDGPRRSNESSTWWTNQSVVRRLGLTESQQNRIEKIVQQSKVGLIDLQANLDKQEVLLQPMLDDEHPQESQVLPQIERVAAARSELEKANARMLFEIRLVLTQQQWKQLQNKDGYRPGEMPPPHRPR